MKGSTIYSIGHGRKKMEDFIGELKSFTISYLIDVRSKPYSKWNPSFNRKLLEIELKKNGIIYVFLGDKLGGLPDDPACYIDGKVQYDCIKKTDSFKEGMNRLLNANDRNFNVVVMCSESKPEECHRSKLIGQELLKFDVSLNHILSTGKIKSQETVIAELTSGVGVIDLWGNNTSFISGKIYK